MEKKRSSSTMGTVPEVETTSETMFLWVSITPLERPVVPEV